MRLMACPKERNHMESINSEKYSRGRRGAPAKGVGRATGARVQIPLSPLFLPKKQEHRKICSCFFILNKCVTLMSYLRSIDLRQVVNKIRSVLSAQLKRCCFSGFIDTYESAAGKKAN